MRNIILCGFMGCGKSTVGRELAAMTSRPFVDMDALLEQEAGCPVAEQFARNGEAAFRRRERALCARLAGQTNYIIATGGGALINEENATVLRATGDIVFLDITADTVLCRLQGDTSRPLLLRDDKASAVRQLLEERRPLYMRAATVTVSGEDAPRQVAAAVLLALQHIR